MGVCPGAWSWWCQQLLTDVFSEIETDSEDGFGHGFYHTSGHSKISSQKHTKDDFYAWQRFFFFLRMVEFTIMFLAYMLLFSFELFCKGNPSTSSIITCAMSGNKQCICTYIKNQKSVKNHIRMKIMLLLYFFKYITLNLVKVIQSTIVTKNIWPWHSTPIILTCWRIILWFNWPWIFLISQQLWKMREYQASWENNKVRTITMHFKVSHRFFYLCFELPLCFLGLLVMISVTSLDVKCLWRSKDNKLDHLHSGLLVVFYASFDTEVAKHT